MGFLSGLSGGGVLDAAGGFMAAGARKKQSKKIIKDYDAAQRGALEGRDASLGYFQPFLEGGQNAFAGAGEMLAPGYQFDSSTDPSYKFNFDEMMRAGNLAAAAGGSLGSGGTIRAAQRNASGLASRTFDNAFARKTQLANFGLQGAQGSANAQNGYTNALFNATQGRAGARGMRADAISDQWGAGVDFAKSVAGAFGGF
jgi:hypothetical protein